MNPNLGVDRVLRDYFAEDGLLAPDHVLDVIEERIMLQPQRRTWRVPRRDARVNTYVKPLLAIAAIVVVAAIAGLALLRPSSPAVGGPPKSTASPAPSPVVTRLLRRPVVVRRRRRAGCLRSDDRRGGGQRPGHLLARYR